MSEDVWLMLGDAVERMAEIPDGSVDAIIADPPYPEIDRPYGRMTEAEWWDMMMGVCAHARRVLTPKGSAVFILQPNSRKVGSMRGWLFEFQAWACREWNMVQDVHWWNTTALPLAGSNQFGLLRPSLKACVWLGPADCFRDQDEILLDESRVNFANRLRGTFVDPERVSRRRTQTEGARDDNERMTTAVTRRGGTTPFNVLPIAGGGPRNPSFGHGAATPNDLADWWTRYITRPGDTVLDPFAGSGTIPLAALNRGRKAIGIERDPGYFATMENRIAAARAASPLFDRPAPSPALA
jgi:DNA modification methylase